MELSKDNIVSKRFSKKFLGGLEEFEVRDFLHVLAEEIRRLSQKGALQKKRIEELEAALRDYRDREHILKESIASAEKWAEKIRKDAESHGALVLEKAESKSESLIQEARQSLQTVYSDIADLKRLQLQFKTGLKAALQVQMDLLDQDPVFSPSSARPAKESLLEEQERSKASGFSQGTGQGPLKKSPLGEKELSSLKKPLGSLDKSFS